VLGKCIKVCPGKEVASKFALPEAFPQVLKLFIAWLAILHPVQKFVPLKPLLPEKEEGYYLRKSSVLPVQSVPKPVQWMQYILTWSLESPFFVYTVADV
jgi:hypothetical protein